MTNLTLSNEAEAPITISLNGQPISVAPGTSVAAAMMGGGSTCRRSVLGEPRSALCGMGICMECRATVNGVPQVRTCLVAVEPGMEIMVP
jgi:D-hydroxyproline dehydrogenase subunit gamma